MKQSLFKKSPLPLLALVIAVFFDGCVSECSVNCPEKCVDISFVILQDGINIIGDQPIFPLNDIYVETIPANPSAPPLLEIKERTFKIILCQNVEYKLYLTSSEVINITAEIDTTSTDSCCSYFSAKSVKFNGFELCQNINQCDGGTFELL